ncbi:MAG TPA: phosphatase PAP2 family protein [Vicinamibacterales bacterium]
MRRAVVGLFGLLLLAPAVSRAQTAPPAMARVTFDVGQPADSPDDPQPPIAQEPKPTRNFFSALVHNIGDDFKHMPRRNSAYWLAGGALAALAVHPLDDNVHEHFLRTGGGNQGVWKAGEIIGETPTILGASIATYIVGRSRQMPRVQHLGMDELESGLLAEGLVNVVKVIGRRKRPLMADGTRASGFSFPSGHSTITFAAATVLQQHLGYKAAIPTYAIATYVAASRLNDNVHWTSDVVMGAALGVMIGRSVTWHGRNFYASPMLLPHGGTGIAIAVPTTF